MKKILTLEELRDHFNTVYVPKSFRSVYEEGCALYKEGFPLLDKDYFDEFNNKYSLFSKYLDIIHEARELIKKDEELIFFMCILSRAVLKFGVNEILCDLNLPKTDNPAMKKAYDFMPMFALLPSVDRTVERYRERNVPENIIKDTLKQYEGVISTNEYRLGYPGYDGVYFGWMLLTVNNLILTVGRLQYEMRDFSGKLCGFKNKNGEIVLLADKMTVNHQGVGINYKGLEDKDGAFYCEVNETDDYYEGYIIKDGYVTKEVAKLKKSEWEKFVSHGDMSISVHIPKGESMTDERCAESYKEAMRIFKECYSDVDFKTTFCHSWLLDPQLKDILKPESNIVKFGNRYMLYPYEESDNDDIFMFVFVKPFKTYDELPESTSLMKALKEHYISGKYIYVCGGILTEF